MASHVGRGLQTMRITINVVGENQGSITIIIHVLIIIVVVITFLAIVSIGHVDTGHSSQTPGQEGIVHRCGHRHASVGVLRYVGIDVHFDCLGYCLLRHLCGLTDLSVTFALRVKTKYEFVGPDGICSTNLIIKNHNFYFEFKQLTSLLFYVLESRNNSAN